MEINKRTELMDKLTRKTATNSTYPKGGVLHAKDSFVVNQKLAIQINICGNNPALQVAANHCMSFKKYSK